MNSFEDIASELNRVDESGMSRLSKLAKTQVDLETRLTDLEQEMKDVTFALKEVQEQEIPALMSELGVKSFKLQDGTEVSVKKYYSASIAKDRADEAFTWLNNNGFGDLIKNQVALSFPRGAEDKADKFAQECMDRGYNPATKKWVEPMTLKAFAREQVEQGTDLPSDLFGLYIGEKAKIEKK